MSILNNLFGILKNNHEDKLRKQQEFITKMKLYELPTRRVITNDGDHGQVLETKISGIPWWPNDIERPKCEHGHLMSFMMQIRLQDIPRKKFNIGGMLSFHYCMECAYAGNMSHGFSDLFGNKGYNVQVFTQDDLDRKSPDGLGIVAEVVLTPSIVMFSDTLEVPTLGDVDDDIVPYIPNDFYHYVKGIFDENIYFDLIHVLKNKIGGWPSWVQSPEWPITEKGKLDFIGQIDWEFGDNAPWCNGGYAYLFADLNGQMPEKGELIIQST